MASKQQMTIKSIVVTGESGRDYEIKAAEDGSLWCSCPSWRNQRNRDASSRLCKHLEFVTRQFAAHFSVVNGIR